jgi:hypothetical protein
MELITSAFHWLLQDPRVATSSWGTAHAAPFPHQAAAWSHGYVPGQPSSSAAGMHPPHPQHPATQQAAQAAEATQPGVTTTTATAPQAAQTAPPQAAPAADTVQGTNLSNTGNASAQPPATPHKPPQPQGEDTPPEPTPGGDAALQRALAEAAEEGTEATEETMQPGTDEATTAGTAATQAAPQLGNTTMAAHPHDTEGSAAMQQIRAQQGGGRDLAPMPNLPKYSNALHALEPLPGRDTSGDVRQRMGTGTESHATTIADSLCTGCSNGAHYISISLASSRPSRGHKQLGDGPRRTLPTSGRSMVARLRSRSTFIVSSGHASAPSSASGNAASSSSGGSDAARCDHDDCYSAPSSSDGTTTGRARGRHSARHQLEQYRQCIRPAASHTPQAATATGRGYTPGANSRRGRSPSTSLSRGCRGRNRGDRGDNAARHRRGHNSGYCSNAGGTATRQHHHGGPPTRHRRVSSNAADQSPTGRRTRLSADAQLAQVLQRPPCTRTPSRTRHKWGRQTTNGNRHRISCYNNC